MTDLLERTITKLRELSVEQQDAIAMMILEELEDDSKWERSFASSQNLLAKLAEDAMLEYRAGKTEELFPESL
ncbi:MAG: hypothetical protein DCE90_10355 [Pseudanabaena sp.]|nr:MAG: hypothetical protein DCE90_10355 [Pseudanabaena sp.]